MLVIVQASDPADQRAFAPRAELDVRWVQTSDEFLAAIQTLELPAGDGFAWCAGEAALMARVRDELLVARKHPKEAARISAYWKQGSSSHHEDL